MSKLNVGDELQVTQEYLDWYAQNVLWHRAIEIGAVGQIIKLRDDDGDLYIPNVTFSHNVPLDVLAAMREAYLNARGE